MGEGFAVGVEVSRAEQSSDSSEGLSPAAVTGRVQERERTQRAWEAAISPGRRWSWPGLARGTWGNLSY